MYIHYTVYIKYRTQEPYTIGAINERREYSFDDVTQQALFKPLAVVNKRYKVFD